MINQFNRQYFTVGQKNRAMARLKTPILLNQRKTAVFSEGLPENF